MLTGVQGIFPDTEIQRPAVVRMAASPANIPQEKS